MRCDETRGWRGGDWEKSDQAAGGVRREGEVGAEQSRAALQLLR